VSGLEGLNYEDIISGRLLLQEGSVTIQGLWAALRQVASGTQSPSLLEALASGPLATLAGAQELERARQKIEVVKHIEVQRTLARLVYLEGSVPQDRIRAIYEELNRAGFPQPLGVRLVAMGLLLPFQLEALRPRVDETLQQARAERVAGLRAVAGRLEERFTPAEGQRVRGAFELAGSMPSPADAPPAPPPAPAPPPTPASAPRIDASPAPEEAPTRAEPRPEPPKLKAEVDERQIATSRFDKSEILAAASDTGTVDPESCPIYGYEIVQELGKGSMGVVYKARHVFSDRLTALKILPLRLAAKRQNLERFKREAMALMRIQHPNVVGAYDFGGSEEYYYLALEFVDGETLEDLLAREGRLDERRALTITRQVALGLAAAAEHGIVHRDIKPENVMITTEGVAKICDFGIVKMQDLDEGGLTIAGTTVGTPFYISPEQARGEDDLDLRSDIYSLGISLFHLTTGQVPFTGKSQGAILVRHILEEVPDPRTVEPSLSLGLAQILARMTKKQPGQRYQAAEELVTDIERLLGNGAG
jgi:serine/threonine-protein kinase